jgi:hypothetical protein
MAMMRRAVAAADRREHTAPDGRDRRSVAWMVHRLAFDPP